MADLAAGAAGLLDNSWPLGFVLDRPALRGTDISVLEAPGRPHADVFVACDLVAGAVAVVAGLLVLRHPLVAAGLVLFGVGNPHSGAGATLVVLTPHLFFASVTA